MIESAEARAKAQILTLAVVGSFLWVGGVSQPWGRTFVPTTPVAYARMSRSRLQPQELYLIILDGRRNLGIASP